jgi:hypothetical protein
MPTLKEKINQFFDTYHAILDFEELELRSNQFLNLDGFLLDKEATDKKALAYLRGLALTYVQALDNTAKMRLDGTYDFTSLDILQFVRDFEALMQAKHEDSKALEARTPYGGASFTKAVNRIIEETTETYNKPLQEIWAKNVREGKYTVYEMKAVAEASIQALQNVSAREIGYEESKHLLNVLRSKAAMEKIRENRGRFWRMRHPIDNYREKKFLRTLKDTVKEYERRKYPMELVMGTNNKPIMESAFAGVKNYKQRQKMKNAGIPKSQSQEVKQGVSQEVNVVENNNVIVESKPKAPIISDVGERMKSMTMNESELALKLVETFPKGTIYKGAILKTMTNGIAERLLMEVQTANNKYDLEIMNGKEQRLAMIDHVKHVFKTAFEVSQMLYGFEKDKYALRLFAAQKITDIVMKDYSPVYFEQEKLAEFANCYPLNHLSHCADSVDMLRTDPVFKEAKDLYDNEREEVSVLINDVDNELVKPIENVPMENQIRINQK